MQNQGRLIVTIKGTTLTDIEKTMLLHPMVAGLIIFPENYIIPKNFRDRIQLRSLMSDIFQTANKPCFVDQEGGYVQRLGRGFESLPAANVFGKAYDLNREVGLELAREYGSIMATQLMEFGLISLAPVCDLDGGNAVISRLNRAFHSEPNACTELIMALIAGMNSNGMQATGKHFPGHGHSYGDTHNDIVVDNRSLAELEASDLAVFSKLIHSNQLAAIMPAHILYTQIDPVQTAGASKIWLQEILRGKYNFKGVIVSDCVTMAGAGDGSLLDKTEHALTFGDVAILCHQEPETVIVLCDQLEQKGYALNSAGQERFARWTKGSEAARRILMQENVAIS